MPDFEMVARLKANANQQKENQQKKSVGVSQGAKTSQGAKNEQQTNQESVGATKPKEEPPQKSAGTVNPKEELKKEPQEQKKEKPQEQSKQQEKTKESSSKKTEEKPAHTPRDSKRSSKVDGRRVSTNTTGIATIPWEGKFDRASLGSMPRDVINIAQESFPELNQTQSVFAYVIANSDKEVPIYTPENIKNMIADYRSKQYFDKVGNDIIELKVLIKNMFVLMRKMSLTADVTEVEVSTLLAIYLGFTRNRPATVDQVDAGDLYLKEFSDKFKDYVNNNNITNQRKDGRPIR